MKKTLTILMIGLLSLSYAGSAGSVSPTIGMRFGDVIGNITTPVASVIIGLELNLGDDVNSGFDSDPNENTSRLYVERAIVGGASAKFGLGTYTATTGGGPTLGNPYFTVGAIYGATDNLNVEVDYAINSLVTNTADRLNITLSVSF